MSNTVYFSSAPRLAALNARHQALDIRIGAEVRRPLPDAMLIQELKRSKRAVKEEIVRIERTNRPAGAGTAA